MVEPRTNQRSGAAIFDWRPVGAVDVQRCVDHSTAEPKEKNDRIMTSHLHIIRHTHTHTDLHAIHRSNAQTSPLPTRLICIRPLWLGYRVFCLVYLVSSVFFFVFSSFECVCLLFNPSLMIFSLDFFPRIDRVMGVTFNRERDRKKMK